MSEPLAEAERDEYACQVLDCDHEHYHPADVEAIVAARLASVKALALEEAAAALDALQTPGNEHYSQRDPALWLHNRAAELRAATESKDVGQ